MFKFEEIHSCHGVLGQFSKWDMTIKEEMISKKGR
jgi:hypothetical protein